MNGMYLSIEFSVWVWKSAITESLPKPHCRQGKINVNSVRQHLSFLVERMFGQSFYMVCLKPEEWKCQQMNSLGFDFWLRLSFTLYQKLVLAHLFRRVSEILAVEGEVILNRFLETEIVIAADVIWFTGY